ncbi:type VII secretion protein EccCa [Mycobacterium sp. 1274761.0]|uniref:type VII secretion protein EccCa n=1 Tax=Mycobacterium sp. 1274761.0 TaxID=1834077 RepID=UPI0007FB7A15|nr:type VII secretion protein EccCa [Mycobacterium sp. 1274761.0]OBK70466.1 type VII secretion protein EccC [Mycobacterium sp. 1274761.0]
MEFSIQPRLTGPPVADEEVVVRPPPDIRSEAPVNPLTRVLPMAMAAASIGMMTLYFTSGASATRSPMFLFFPVMMVLSMLGTVATGSRGGSRVAEINLSRRDYLNYLASVDAKMLNTADEQRVSLVWQHPDPCALWMIIGGRRMWERRPDDADFGHVRIGLGPRRVSTRLIAPDLEPLQQRDPVTSTELQRLVLHRSTVPDLPVSIPLTDFTAISLSGDTVAARRLLRAMICQLAVMHSPNDLRIAAVVDPITAENWDWLKWLPHHQHPSEADGAGSARLTYRDLPTAQTDLVGCRTARTVLLVDGGLADPFVSEQASLTVVALDAACDGGAELTLVVSDDAVIGDEVRARPDAMTVGQAISCARRLSPFRPAGTSAAGDRIASTSGWPELMGFDDVGSIDVTTRWRSVRRPEQVLRVPIGIAEHGDAAELDIKEAAANGMGPHGLCVGATGSGKSEFLRTLTLGMIAAHPPHMLNLVLVDFKGGATFLGLERAPHVAAVITNLADEAHLVARMKEALSGEVTRRQELLRAAGRFANIGEYNRACSQGAGLAALPTLFIIVDEFSELLSQQPDFIDLFIAIGRLGRSLGMHLLLASQRVDEGRLRGLDSHLSYRVCLKTFSASESRSVLGVSDAFQLPSTPGAAFLKTGAGEPVRFQTAFVSGPCRPKPARSGGAVTIAAPQLFTAARTGCVTVEDEKRSAASRTVLDTVVDQIQGHGTRAHQVWLPPLAESPDLAVLLHHAGPQLRLTVPVGLVDCPFEQRRELLVAQLAGAAGNVAVVGGPQSGKSTALRTLILALAETHDPRDVQVYCLDFGGGTLSSLRSVPHVGSVATRREIDLVRRTVAQLESILRSREAQRASGVAGDVYGEVFLVIDGWATVRHEFDSLEAPITALASQGLSYGIHVVISASRWAEIRPAFKDQTGTRIELRLGDPAESEMDRKRARQLVNSPPGRGITRDGREFVVATAAADGTVASRLSARYAQRVAPPILVLPERVDYTAVIADKGLATEIVLGLGEIELQPLTLDFAAEGHLIVLGQGECGKTATLRTLCREIVRVNTPEAAQLFLVDVRRTLLGVVESDHVSGYAASAQALAPQLRALMELLQARLPGENVTQQQLRERSWWSGPEIYVVIDDYDLIAPPSGVNALAPLADFLPHAKDLGLHVVVARRSGGAARAMFDPVLARMRDVGCMGLMMSASPEEGVLLGSVRPSPLPPGRATLVSRSYPEQLVQITWCEPV